MAKIGNLQELSADGLNDLWSANNQMARALKIQLTELAEAAVNVNAAQS